MAQIGQEVYVKDLKLDRSKIKINSDENEVIVKVEPLVSEEVQKEIAAEEAKKAEEAAAAAAEKKQPRRKQDEKKTGEQKGNVSKTNITASPKDTSKAK